MRIAVAVCVVFAAALSVDAAVYFKEQFLDGGNVTFITRDIIYNVTLCLFP